MTEIAGIPEGLRVVRWGEIEPRTTMRGRGEYILLDGGAISNGGSNGGRGLVVKLLDGWCEEFDPQTYEWRAVRIERKRFYVTTLNEKQAGVLLKFGQDAPGVEVIELPQAHESGEAAQQTRAGINQTYEQRTR